LTSFLDERLLRRGTWQSFERAVTRYLIIGGWTNVRLVGQTGDGGADVIASRGGRRWLFQVKYYQKAVGAKVFAETVDAAARYEAQISVIVSSGGFTAELRDLVQHQMSDGPRVQLWDIGDLARYGSAMPDAAPAEQHPDSFKLRRYQEDACQSIVRCWLDNPASSALVVLATGLGKTFVAGESVRRISSLKRDIRVLVLAHTNDLVRQLERSFWPFLRSSESTMIATGEESFEWDSMKQFNYVFGSRDTFASRVGLSREIPQFDVVVVDECHHLSTATYDRIFDALSVGESEGPFLIGLTATDWRPDGQSLDQWFSDPVVRIDLVDALKSGFLSNVDYRMYTDNIDWTAFDREDGDGLYSPKAINKAIFIREWDEAVVSHLRNTWEEVENLGMQPRCVVFCSTIEHAERVAAQVNSIELTNATTLHSGRGLSAVERNKRLWDFSEGRIGVMCVVDVFNEGIDVPDVNLVVFLRVTHSRRIFIQQLGRGLRIVRGKSKVIVLDFVSDIRRFAEGLDMKSRLQPHTENDLTDEVVVGNRVESGFGSQFSFRRSNSEDLEGEAFLSAWLGEIKDLKERGDDVAILRFPDPHLTPHGR